MVMLEGTAEKSVATEPWGLSRRMTDFEAIMWRVEVDARLRSDAVILEILDCAPDWDRFVAGHEWACRLVPRLRQRVADDALFLRPPAWVPADLDMGYHLSRVRIAENSDQALMDLVSSVAMAPFDRARPLWKGVLVEGLPEGRAAYLFKVHHAMTDGQGLMQLFDTLHSHRREPTAKAPIEIEAGGEDDGIAGRARRSLALGRDAVGGSFGLADRLGSAARRRLANPTTARAAWDYAQSINRVSKPPGDPSPLLRKRGLARRMRAIEIPLPALRAGGRAAGGSLNDAYLAGMVGGLRYYHLHHGAEIGDLPIGFPVSLRRPEHALGGNQFGGACIAGPSSEADPAARVKLVRERALAVRDEPALNFLGLTAPITSRLPPPLLAHMTRRFASSLDLQASNIPGLNRPAFIAGARIERMYGFGPVPGGAMMTTLLSHEGVCCIGISMDHDAVPDPDVLTECFQRGLHEVAALGRDLA
jgi:diacylglycerol O-acyltransferase / wax synthase